MKQKFYILLVLAIVSTLYGTYSAYKMVLQNRTPYSITCIGKKLSLKQVIAFSNKASYNKDTLNFAFENSKVIMLKQRL